MREPFCTLIVVAAIGVYRAVKIHGHIYQEKKSLFYCLFKIFFKMERELLNTSFRLCLISPSPLWSPTSLCILGQCCFWEGLCHHLNDQANSCRWAPLCLSEPFYHLFQVFLSVKAAWSKCGQTQWLNAHRMAPAEGVGQLSLCNLNYPPAELGHLTKRIGQCVFLYCFPFLLGKVSCPHVPS